MGGLESEDLYIHSGNSVGRLYVAGFDDEVFPHCGAVFDGNVHEKGSVLKEHIGGSSRSINQFLMIQTRCVTLFHKFLFF